MSKKIIVALINSAAMIIVAIIGVGGTKIYEQAKVKDAFSVEGDTIIGDGKNITEDDIAEFVNNYLELQTENKDLLEQNKNYSEDLQTVNSKYEDLKSKADDKIQELEQSLKEQKVVTLSSPDLKILGENVNTTLTDYVATIDGRIYYSEGFLNTFLPNKISNNNGIVQYGENIPEKINVVSAGLIYDNSGFDLYNGDSHFMMSLQEYKNGLIGTHYTKATLSIACEEKYSELSFILGHIDNSSSSDSKLIIYYLDTDGEYKEACSINLYKDIPVEPVTVPIYNTKTVKIVINNTAYARYGLADMYLIK